MGGGDVEAQDVGGAGGGAGGGGEGGGMLGGMHGGNIISGDGSGDGSGDRSGEASERRHERSWSGRWVAQHRASAVVLSSRSGTGGRWYGIDVRQLVASRCDAIVEGAALQRWRAQR